jgi:hypothetical protein
MSFPFIGAGPASFTPMDPIAVAAALLRAQLPDVPLRAGATLVARVASRGEQHAIIVLAGIPLTAQVPPNVRAGATLKLKVQEVTAERITLQIEPDIPADQPAAAAAAAPLTVGQPLLAGQPPPAFLSHPQVAVDEPPARRRGADGQPADVVSLAFTSPTLGRLDLRLELRGERLLAEVTTAAGLPHSVASAAAERLRARLTAAGLDPTVKVLPRHTPFDLYA